VLYRNANSLNSISYLRLPPNILTLPLLCVILFSVSPSTISGLMKFYKSAEKKLQSFIWVIFFIVHLMLGRIDCVTYKLNNFIYEYNMPLQTNFIKLNYVHYFWETNCNNAKLIKHLFLPSCLYFSFFIREGCM
jgi:hypothetical protein